MSLRDDVLVQRNGIDRQDLDLLIEHVRQARMRDSLVSNFEDPQDTDGTEWVVNRNVRDTQEVDLTPAIAEKLGNIASGNIVAFINPFYAVEVRDSEPLQLLHYGVGGHYIPHVDAETLYKDDAGLEMWEKTLDRDLSVVYFLNDDFEGGELVFPALDLVIEPEAGALVCFPSDHHFIHGVNPVTAGHRYTAVTWMRIKGMPTPEEINQMALDEYNRMWPKQVEQRSRVARGGVPVR
jgi:predicted 2-oxoglutarate/Fe(II)-dependent dioxygenase YbiX